jgi:hypothetical protein
VVDRCGLGVARSVAIGRFGWSFPFGGPFGGLDPQDVPRSEFLMVHSIQLGETDILRYFTSWCVAAFVTLHNC